MTQLTEEKYDPDYVQGAKYFLPTKKKKRAKRRMQKMSRIINRK